MTPRPMAFRARATPRTPTRPTADDGPNDKPPPPKPDVPQSGKSRQTRGFGIPANAAEQTSRLRPHSPPRSLPVMTPPPQSLEARTNLGPPPSSPTTGLRAHVPLPSLPAMSTFPATDEVRTNFGHSPSSPTDGLRTHVPLPSLPAMATFPATDEVRTNFGLMGPAGPPLTGHSSTLPPAAIVAATGKFKAPSSTRRTSPVMTKDRVSPP